MSERYMSIPLSLPSLIGYDPQDMNESIYTCLWHLDRPSTKEENVLSILRRMMLEVSIQCPP